VLLAAASLVVTMILSLVAMVLVIAVSDNGELGTFTWDNYADLFGSGFAMKALRNTLVYVLVSTATAVAIGVPAAWLVERTDLPGKGFVHTVFVVGVLIPGFFVAMGWLFMFHPKVGLVNQALMELFDLHSAPFDVVSIPRMGFVQGLSLAAVVFAMTSATFRTMSVDLEEAARAAGGNFYHQMRRITLPLAAPSILAATLYVAIIAFGAFDVPAIIGLSAREYTFSTFLYYNVNPQSGFPRYGLVAAFSTIMIIVGVVLSWIYARVLKHGDRYRVVTGKNYKASVVALGRWKWVAWLLLGGYFLTSKIMPLLAIVWIALLPRIERPSMSALSDVSLDNLFDLPRENLVSAALHTILLVLVVPTIAIVWSVVISWIAVRSRYRFRVLFDYAAFIPHAVPTLILGVGAFMLGLFVFPRAWGLHGSLILLGALLSIAYISFITRMTNASLLQLHPDLEEAAGVAGAGTYATLRRVVLPLLRPTLQSAWLWVAILTFRELTLPLILFSPDNVTLSVTVWNLYSAGEHGQAAMTTVFMLCVVAPLALVYNGLTKRRG
jgi:iron(III) transport system permease protein